ncbi:S8 family serine peptidase [bacterium]|nr:S8 family serine peptidase [bacterium]
MTMKKGMPFIIMIAVLFLLAGASWASSYKPGELLIKFKSQLSEESIVHAAQSLGLQTKEKKVLQQALLSPYGKKISTISERLGVGQWQLADPNTLQQVLKTLQQSSLVEYIEPNYRRIATAPLTNGPNDAFYQNGSQWWLEAVAADRAFAEGLIPSGNTIIIAIVDSGIRLDHQDLSAQLVTGRDYVNLNGNANDDEGHGTHVAGIIGATTHNTIGIAGTACDGSIQLMPIKALDSDGVGFDSDIAGGIIWAVDHGARVLNLSFGSDAMGKTLQDAVDYAYQQGCVVVASAGNFAQEGNPIFYPAAYPSVIAVAATTSTGAWADYSEYHDYVDIAAPGGHDSGNNATMLLSTYFMADDSYAYSYGTSMASPVVAGAAALLLIQNSDLAPDEVKNRLCMTATKTGSLVNDPDGWNRQLGWGQVNVYQALRNTTTYVLKKTGRSSYNFPNPFQPARGEKTEIMIPAEQAGGVVKLTILDAMGHLVYTQTVSGSVVYPGATLVWDGHDNQGDWVANGIYFYRLDVNGEIYENKIAVLNQ